MAITAQELIDLRIIICSAGSGITPTLLASYAEKTDEEIRAMISEYKQRQIDYLTSSKASIESQLSALQG